jgi:hypothetical protein
MPLHAAANTDRVASTRLLLAVQCTHSGVVVWLHDSESPPCRGPTRGRFGANIPHPPVRRKILEELFLKRKQPLVTYCLCIVHSLLRLLILLSRPIISRADHDVAKHATVTLIIPIV